MFGLRWNLTLYKNECLSLFRGITDDQLKSEIQTFQTAFQNSSFEAMNVEILSIKMIFKSLFSVDVMLHLRFIHMRKQN